MKSKSVQLFVVGFFLEGGGAPGRSKNIYITWLNLKSRRNIRILKRSVLIFGK